MEQTTETSSPRTVVEARARTAGLIAACPDWCKTVHDADSHPEDVRHDQFIGSTSVGTVSVYVYAVPMPGEKAQGGIEVDVDRIDKDGLDYDEAMNTASVMIQAAVALKAAMEAVAA